MSLAGKCAKLFEYGVWVVFVENERIAEISERQAYPPVARNGLVSSKKGMSAFSSPLRKHFKAIALCPYVLAMTRIQAEP